MMNFNEVREVPPIIYDILNFIYDKDLHKVFYYISSCQSVLFYYEIYAVLINTEKYCIYNLHNICYYLHIIHN